MLLIILIVTALSEEILKDFETFYLTPNESVSLRLHDYFSHNEIDFYISNTNMTGNDIKLKHDSSLDLISHLPTKSKSTNYMNLNKIFPFIEFPEGIFFLAYDSNQISSYLFEKNTSKVEGLWNFQIKNNTIIQAAIYRYLYTNSIILVTKFLKYPKFGIWENEVYLIKFKEFMKPEYPIKLNLWDIKYIVDLKISDMEEQTLNVVAFFGRFKNRKQAVFLYDFTYINSGQLIYSFDSYIGLKEFEDCEMNIVQAWIEHGQLYLLDSKLGLIIYKTYAADSKWQYHDFIDLRKYGSMSNMIKPTRNITFQPIGISTDSGVIFTTQRLPQSPFYWVNTYDAFNALLPINSIHFCANFLFMQVETNDTLYLTVYEFTEIWENSVQHNIANFDLKKVVDRGFDKNGMWMTVFFNKKMFYIRQDCGGIRVFLVNCKDWTIEIIGNSSFYAEITGKSNHTNKKSVKKSFNIFSVTSNALDIYKKNLAPIDIYLYGPSSQISINADSLYSGPNLTYSLIDNELPSDITVSWSFPDHDDILSEIILLPNPSFIKYFERVIIYGFDDTIIAQDFDNIEDVQVLSNSSNILRFWYLASTLKWFIVSYDIIDQTFLFSRCYRPISEGDIVCSKIQSDVDCLFFAYCKAAGAIFCANQAMIDVYIGNTIEKLVRINKEILDIENDFYIAGLEIIEKVSLYEYNILLYVIYNNGMIIIDFPKISIENHSFSYKIINGFHKDIKEISTSMDKTVALLFSDSSVGIYDKSLNHIKTLGPHLKGTIKYFNSVKNILLLQVDNIIAVYDWTKFAFEALQYTIILDNSCRLADSKNGLSNLKEFPVICQLEDKSILKIYELRCDRYKYSFENKCSLPIGINIKLSQSFYSENKIEEGKFSILAENADFKSIVDLKFNFHKEHNAIWIENKNLPKLIEVPYHQQKIIDLSRILYGNDIKASIIINDINCESVNPELSPIHLKKNFNEISSIKIESCYEKTYEIFVKNAKKTVINGKNEFIILDHSKNIPMTDSVLFLKDFVFGKNISCDNFYAIDFNENIILIFGVCKYIAPTEEFWDEKALVEAGHERYILLIIKYDFIKKSSLWSESNIWIPSFVETLNVVKLNNQRFEIFLYERKASFKDYENSCILRYKGLLNENGIFLKKIENIDFFSLGLNSFLIQSSEITLSKFGVIYLYIIDFSFGLRIIEIQENSPAIVIEGLPHARSNKFISLTICENRLFIMTNSMTLLEYSIDDIANIKLSRSLSCNLNSFVPTIYYSKLISCQDDCNYIIFTDKIFEKSTEIEIINLNDSPVNFFTFFTTVLTNKIIFIENNVISFIDTLTKTLNEYSINKKIIEIPAISEESYKKLIKWWENEEFHIQVQAENLSQKLISDVIVLKRGETGKESSFKWWIWTLGGMIIILLGTAIAYGIYYSKKRKNQRISNFLDEGVMMEEMSSI